MVDSNSGGSRTVRTVPVPYVEMRNNEQRETTTRATDMYVLPVLCYVRIGSIEERTYR